MALTRVTDRFGTKGSSVTVTVQGGGTASLFSDAAGTQALTNPVTVRPNGTIDFYVAPGTYVLTESVNGTDKRTITVAADPSAVSSGGLLALVESYPQINTAGTVVQQLIGATWTSDGITPVDITAAGGSYSASVISAPLTWDLYDAQALKVLRALTRSAPATAYLSDDVPVLTRRGVIFPAGLQTVYLRCKPASNTLLQFLNQPTTATTDESPLHLAVSRGAFA